MIHAILALFSAFNPIIVGLLLAVGAYFSLRHRTIPPVEEVAQRAWNSVCAVTQRLRFNRLVARQS